MQRLIASHIMMSYRQQQFAFNMLPLNVTMGVDGGMDFIIKTAQLGIEKYTTTP